MFYRFLDSITIFFFWFWIVNLIENRLNCFVIGDQQPIECAGERFKTSIRVFSGPLQYIQKFLDCLTHHASSASGNLATSSNSSMKRAT